MALVSVATLKEYLPELTGSGADTELSNLINRVESIIGRFLGFPPPDNALSVTLGSAIYTVYVDSPSYTNKNLLLLPIKPIISITSVFADATRVYGADTEITSAEYDIDKKAGRLILKENVASIGFSRGFQANKVYGTFGFTSADTDLIHAVCVYCAHLHRAKSSQGKKSQGIRDASTTYAENTMPAEVKQVLYPLRSSLMII